MCDDLLKSMIAKLREFMPKESYDHSPVQNTAVEAARYLLRRKKITILTGAGVSAASGIPTFRGQDGFWKEKKRYVGESNPMEILTTDFFNNNPMAVWEWHWDFIKLAADKQTNDGHRAIRNF